MAEPIRAAGLRRLGVDFGTESGTRIQHTGARMMDPASHVVLRWRSPSGLPGSVVWAWTSGRSPAPESNTLVPVRWTPPNKMAGRPAPRATPGWRSPSPRNTNAGALGEPSTPALCQGENPERRFAELRVTSSPMQTLRPAKRDSTSSRPATVGRSEQIPTNPDELCSSGRGTRFTSATASASST
jgi:hypothetical protein